MAEEKKVSLTKEQVLEAFRQSEAELNAIQQRMQMVQGMARETIDTIETLNGLDKAEKSGKIMVHLGSGIYADASIDAGKKVKVSIAGNVLLDSDAKKAIEDLQKRKENIEKELLNLQTAQADEMKAYESLRQIFATAEELMQKQMQQQKQAKEQNL